MGRPSLSQIAQAIVQSARAGESDADFDVRLAGLSRLSDAELAAMGIYPPPRPGPEAVERPSQTKSKASRKSRNS